MLQQPPSRHIPDAQAVPTATPSLYCGRFAPTPSGPLHLGSLTTALASWIVARRAGGRWLLRIDDLDRERCRPAHSERIQGQLRAHGLDWDGAAIHQSLRLAEYAAALAQLRANSPLYACDCSRRRLQQESAMGPRGPIYSGRCRCRQLPLDGEHAWRLALPASVDRFDDGLLGPLAAQLDLDIGDFVLRRRDGSFGYQLACAVDEHLSNITEVVRGADLIDSSFCQRAVLDRLGLPSPAYAHLPLLTDAQGRKLSKQNHAPAIDETTATANLAAALRFLGQAPPAALERESIPMILDWALHHWRPAALRQC